LIDGKFFFQNSTKANEKAVSHQQNKLPTKNHFQLFHRQKRLEAEFLSSTHLF